MPVDTQCHLGQSSPIGLRAKKKRQVRQALIDAALELFETRGFEAVTIDEIAEAAGVSRRTFFRYFPSKEEVAFPNRERNLARFRELLADTGELEPLAAIRAAGLEMAAELGALRDQERRQQRAVTTSPALIARERQLFEEWEAAIAERLLGGSTDPAAARRARVRAAAIAAAIRVTMREWIRDGGTADLAELGVESFDALLDLRGLEAAKTSDDKEDAP